MERMAEASLTAHVPEPLTAFFLPGADGFPCCSKDSVDIVETQ